MLLISFEKSKLLSVKDIVYFSLVNTSFHSDSVLEIFWNLEFSGYFFQKPLWLFKKGLRGQNDTYIIAIEELSGSSRILKTIKILQAEKINHKLSTNPEYVMWSISVYLFSLLKFKFKNGKYSKQIS